MRLKLSLEMRTAKGASVDPMTDEGHLLKPKMIGG
jgi:hypothetical protein